MGAVRAATRKKRIDQMLAELAGGEGYMNMGRRPRPAPRAAAASNAKSRRKRAP